MSGRRFQRASSRRDPAPRIIVACEGKTERLYLNGLRMQLRLPKGRVHFASPHGTDPLELVNCLVRYRRKLKQEHRWDERDQYWVVMDGHEHRADRLRNWADAHDLAGREGVEIALSNPCFETWLLLHFQDYPGPMSAADAVKAISTHMAGYAKGGPFPDAIWSLTERAMANADALEARFESVCLQDPPNPYTNVQSLVRALEQLACKRGP